MDVTRADEIAAVIGEVVAEFGRLDILVNNAGVNTLAHRVTIDQFPREEWDRLLSVDLTGVYEVSRVAARVMTTREPGGSSTSRRSSDWCRCGCNVPSWRPRPGS